MIRFALIAVLALVGCKQANPESCDNPNSPHPDCRDGGPDAAGDCDPACTGGEVCNPDNDVCVECLSAAQCPMQDRPICDTATNTCVGCTTHADCASNACLPSGACAAEDEVAYVEGGSVGDCSRLTPCGLLSQAVATTQEIIKVNESTTNIAELAKVVLDRPLLIVADKGARLESVSSAQILEVKDTGTDVSIFDLELVGKLANDDAITLAGGMPRLTLGRMIIRGVGGRGIDATAGEIFVRQSIIASNIGGGVNLDTRFTFTNNIVVLNGNVTNPSGGARVTPFNGAVFEFNTIAENTSAGTDGVICTDTFSADNNIVSMDAISVACTLNFTLFEPVILGTGTNNVGGNPQFISRVPGEFASAGFFRIMGTSPAKNLANPAATLEVDIDGQARPDGNGRDSGADEIP